MTWTVLIAGAVGACAGLWLAAFVGYWWLRRKLALFFQDGEAVRGMLGAFAAVASERRPLVIVTAEFIDAKEGNCVVSSKEFFEAFLGPQPDFSDEAFASQPVNERPH